MRKNEKLLKIIKEIKNFASVYDIEEDYALDCFFEAYDGTERSVKNFCKGMVLKSIRARQKELVR